MSQHSRGFTLVESLVAAAVFLIVAVGIYEAYINVFIVVDNARWRGTATLLADEQFEILHNMPYSEVGIVGGVPSGIFPRVQTLARDGATFTATTSIRNIDDPFDGTLGGTPNDTAPADYKQAQIDIACTSCKSFTPLSFTARFAPKSLENTSSNGALFIKVFDADGDPVPQAEVKITNISANPQINIDDVTDNDGNYELVDVPPGTNTYNISVTKAGYSTDKTYPASGGTPHPTEPNATVATGQVTQTSFSIDKVSTMYVSSVTDTCTVVPAATFTLSGSKIISTPSTLKFSQSFTTSAGSLTIPNLEWDTYTLAMNDVSYDLEGIIPLLPFNVAPDSSQNVELILAPKNSSGSSVMVTVKDSASGLPITGATVNLTKSGNTTSLTSGQGYLRQTDWSGGSGQADFTNISKYWATDSNIDNGTTGSLKLRKSGNRYISDGNLTSSSFNTGTTSNFYQITWSPQSQGSAGSSAVRVQIATNNDDTTWNYVGPDGTASTYYTTTNGNISGSMNGNQYLRYKLFLHTDNTTVTPTVSDISFTYSSSCAPPGQVFFIGLASGTYSMTVSAPGYQNYTNNSVSVPSGWSSQQVGLNQ